MGIISRNNKYTFNIKRDELRRLIKRGKWAAFVENFKAIRDVGGKKVKINRI